LAIQPGLHLLLQAELLDACCLLLLAAHQVIAASACCYTPKSKVQ
jgi:hypothetical protein